MGFLEIKKELNKLEKSQLIDLISDLYKKEISLKEYFGFYLKPDEKKLLDEYKSKVKEGFFPKRGFPKLSISRKAINDFKKFEVSQECVADIMLYYVECGIEFINGYGDDDEHLITSLENAYEKTLKLIDKENLLEKFKERAKSIYEKSDGFGYGFEDIVGDCYSYYYES
ncbi:MAG: DUF6155 family protein [bacterium]